MPWLVPLRPSTKVLIKGHGQLWTPQSTTKKEDDKLYKKLQAAINKLSAEVAGSRDGGEVQDFVATDATAGSYHLLGLLPKELHLL
jgi:hypothetical protein